MTDKSILKELEGVHEKLHKLHELSLELERIHSDHLRDSHREAHHARTHELWKKLELLKEQMQEHANNKKEQEKRFFEHHLEVVKHANEHLGHIQHLWRHIDEVKTHEREDEGEEELKRELARVKAELQEKEDYLEHLSHYHSPSPYYNTALHNDDRN